MSHLVTSQPNVKPSKHAVGYWMERGGVYPIGLTGFICVNRVFDSRTQIVNFRSAIAYSLVRGIIKKEKAREANR